MKLKSAIRNSIPICCAIGLVLVSSLTLEAKKKKEPPTKSVHGHVVDARKKSISGAKVFVRNVSKKTTRTLITDEDGLYAVYGLDPKVDYEVYAEYGKFVSEKRQISAFLNRFDNVFNFELGPSASSTGVAPGTALSSQTVQLIASDRVKLVGSWSEPANEEGKLPAVLLVHGFGQDRGQWDGFIKDQLVPAGFAAMSLDLRGHGESKDKAGAPLNAEASWRSDPKQFPLDIEAAIGWLKSRDDVDANRIAIVGCDLGADLAFFASGKFEEVRSAVAISGDAENAELLAKAIPDFQPHSILYVATQGDSRGTSSAREFEKRTGFPVRVEIYENSEAKGATILQEIPRASGLVIDWLRKM